MKEYEGSFPPVDTPPHVPDKDRAVWQQALQALRTGDYAEVVKLSQELQGGDVVQAAPEVSADQNKADFAALQTQYDEIIKVAYLVSELPADYDDESNGLVSALKVLATNLRDTDQAVHSSDSSAASKLSSLK